MKDKIKKFWKDNVSFSRSMVFVTFGEAGIGRDDSFSGHKDGIGIQIYWPAIKVVTRYGKELPFYEFKKYFNEFTFAFNTNFRLVVADGQISLAVKILGFGVGIQYQNLLKLRGYTK